MEKTIITPQLLLEKGFEEKGIPEQIFYVKGDCALTYTHAWRPCNLSFGTPLTTNVYINTWEEFEKLMEEGGVK